MRHKLKPKKRYLFRIIIPSYPPFTIYAALSDKTTALGPVCVATAAREVEGWDVEVIDENNLRRFGPRDPSRGADHERIQNQRPADLVGLYGGLTSTIPRVHELAEFYKSRGVCTVAGGQHFVEETIPETLSSGIDYIVMGEAEETIKDLLTSLTDGGNLSSIPGLVYEEEGKIIRTPCRDPVQGLDALPLPDFSLLRYANLSLFPVGRVRGCGMNCEFCTVKGRPRYASPERLMEQVSKLVETMSAKRFFIVDDLFGQDRADTLRLCRMLKEYQDNIGKSLKLAVQIRLDKAKDTELLKAMRNAGVGMVAIGLESPIKQELAAMNKKMKPEGMLQMIRVFHQFGFFIHGMFIFGYPMKEGTTFEMSARERVKHFKRFIKKSRIDTLQIHLPVPLPGSELRARLSRQKRIYPLKDVGWEYYDGSFPIIEHDKPMTSEETQYAMQKLMGRFYSTRYLFMFLLHLISFPRLIFHLANIKSGWRRWYRKWRNYLLRMTGSKIIKNWTRQLQRGIFSEKLKKAKLSLKKL